MGTTREYMDNLVFFNWYEVLPTDNSDIIMFVEGDTVPHVLYVGYGAKLSYAGTNKTFEVPENKCAVYCYCDALRSLASVISFI